MKVEVEDYDVISKLSADNGWHERVNTTSALAIQIEKARLEVIYFLDDIKTRRRLELRRVGAFQKSRQKP